MAERLARASTASAQAQRDLGKNHQFLGFLAERAADPATALRHYGQSRDILVPLMARNPTSANYRNDLAWVEAHLRAPHPLELHRA